MPETCAYKMFIYRTTVRLGQDPDYGKEREEYVFPKGEGDPEERQFRANELLTKTIYKSLIADYTEARKSEEYPEDQYDGFIIAACSEKGDKPEVRVIADQHLTPIIDDDDLEEIKEMLSARSGFVRGMRQ